MELVSFFVAMIAWPFAVGCTVEQVGDARGWSLREQCAVTVLASAAGGALLLVTYY